MFDFFSHLEFTHPTLFVFLKYWPMTIFVPAILLMIATLSFVTRAWDDRERRQTEGEPRRVEEN